MDAPDFMSFFAVAGRQPFFFIRPNKVLWASKSKFEDFEAFVAVNSSLNNFLN